MYCSAAGDIYATPDKGKKKKNKKQGRTYDNAGFSGDEYENCRRDEGLYENTQFPAQKKQVSTELSKCNNSIQVDVVLP